MLGIPVSMHSCKIFTYYWCVYLRFQQPRLYSVKWQDDYWIMNCKRCERPVTVAARSKAWTVFARSDVVIMDSNRTQGMDVWCVHVFFCVCVVLYLGRVLATSWSLVQGVLPIVNRSGDWKAARSHKGCRAIQTYKQTKSVKIEVVT
jgi:hypothetical protein